MIKVEHKHGKRKHIHFGGDVEHNHDEPEREPVESLEHWHINAKTQDKVCHAHKGGNVPHNHSPEANKRLTDYWRE